MKKNNEKLHTILFGMILLMPIFLPLVAHPQEAFPNDFFTGKWGGTIQGVIVDEGTTYPFLVELVGQPGNVIAPPFGGGAPAWMKITGTWPGEFTLIDTLVIGLVIFGTDHAFFSFLFDVSAPASQAEVTYSIVFHLAGFAMEVESEDLIRLRSGGVDPELWEDSRATGKLYRIYQEKDVLDETIPYRYRITTDQFLQREIKLRDVGELTIDVNTECTLTDENGIYIELDEGRLFGEVYTTELSEEEYERWLAEYEEEHESIWERSREFVEERRQRHMEARPEGVDEESWLQEYERNRFTIKGPEAIAGVRGTRFVMEVAKDGSTTLTVMDGVMVFADRQLRKIVLVRDKQTSTVKPGQLPTDPVSIEEADIPKWW